MLEPDLDAKTRVDKSSPVQNPGKIPAHNLRAYTPYHFLHYPHPKQTTRWNPFLSNVFVLATWPRLHMSLSFFTWHPLLSDTSACCYLTSVIYIYLYLSLCSTGFSGVEDVPIFRRKQGPPLAKSEELEDELLLRTTGSNSGRTAGLTSSPDEEVLEEKVECLSLFNVVWYHCDSFFSLYNLV